MATCDPSWPQILTAGAALVSAIVGPVIAMHLSNRSVRAQVVSAGRQRWVDGLRDELAALHAGYFMAQRYFALHHGGHHSDRAEFIEDRQNYFDSVQAMGVTVAKLRLRLRKDNVMQGELLAMIDSLAKASGNDPAENALPDRIVAQGVDVIRAELLKAERVE